MPDLNPLVAVRVALGGGAEWAWTLTRRGADLADRLLGFVVRRGEAVFFAGPGTTAADGPQAAVEEAKYHLGPDVALGGLDDEPGELPDTYGRDRLMLLPRDPRSAFAYWEITLPTRARVLGALGAAAGRARVVLRVHDATAVASTGEGAWPSFDLEPIPAATSAYVTLPRPAASCRVELGLRTPDERFFPLARSNSVTLPAASPAADTTVRWLQLGRRARPLAAAVERNGQLDVESAEPRHGRVCAGEVEPSPDARAVDPPLAPRR